MSRKHAKNATSGPEVEKTESLNQIDGEKIEAVVDVPDGHDNQKVEASEAAAEPVADPAEKLSADIAKHVAYWATEIKEISFPRRLFGSRLFRDGVEIKGFKADLKLVYVFLLRLHEKAEHWAVDIREQKDVPFTLTIPVGVIRDAFGLTEATTQRYLAMLGEGQEGKKTGTTFFGLVEWKQGCKGFHIVNIHDLRFNDVAGFELK